MLKKEAKLEVDETHVEALGVLKRDLFDATNTTLRLAKPGLQYVLLCDASYHGAGFLLMVEDDTKVLPSGKKSYTPVPFGSHLFNTAQLKFSIYYKEFLALYFALDTFAHYLWESTKPVIILTDNKSLTRFFQSKTVPPSLWNCLDRVLSFNLTIAHIIGRANYAADFLSRIETDKSSHSELKLTDKIPVREIEIETEAKQPDASLARIETFDELFSEEPLDPELEVQLRNLGVYDVYVEQRQQRASIDGSSVVGFIHLVQKRPTLLVFDDRAIW